MWTFAHARSGIKAITELTARNGRTRMLTETTPTTANEFSVSDLLYMVEYVAASVAMRRPEREPEPIDPTPTQAEVPVPWKEER